MSRLARIVVCATVLYGLPLQPLHAQSDSPTQAATAPAQQTQTQTQTAPANPPAIDPTKLGISFDRVRMELTQPPPDKGKALKIQETIEVVGKAPTRLLWDPKTVNLTSNAVPYGAPTQKDIMKLIVPQEFQNYPFDLNALMAWLAEHLNKKSE